MEFIYVNLSCSIFHPAAKCFLLIEYHEIFTSEENMKRVPKFCASIGGELATNVLELMIKLS